MDGPQVEVAVPVHKLQLAVIEFDVTFDITHYKIAERKNTGLLRKAY